MLKGNLASLRKRYERAGRDEVEVQKVSKPSASEVRRIIEELDGQGRWVSIYQGPGLTGQLRLPPGTTYIASSVFSRNVEILSRYLEPTGSE